MAWIWFFSLTPNDPGEPMKLREILAILESTLMCVPAETPICVEKGPDTFSTRVFS
jgi:hypothetical protein